MAASHAGGGMRDAMVGAMAVGAACFLCLFPLIFVFTGIFLVFSTGQGLDLLERSVRAAEHESRGFFVLASIAVWVVATWYSARLLLDRMIDAPLESTILRLISQRHAWRPNIWTPRALGALIYPPLIAEFVLRGHAWQAAAVLAIGAVWLACVGLWPRFFAEAAPAGRVAWSETRRTLAVLAALSALHAFVAASLVSEAALPRFISGPAVLLTFASWTLVGSLWFVRLPKGVSTG
jgi:hypothetical protein